MLRYPHHHQPQDYAYHGHRLNTSTHLCPPDVSCCYWKGKWLQVSSEWTGSTENSSYGVPTPMSSSVHCYTAECSHGSKNNHQDTGDFVEPNSCHFSVPHPNCAKSCLDLSPEPLSTTATKNVVCSGTETDPRALGVKNCCLITHSVEGEGLAAPQQKTCSKTSFKESNLVPESSTSLCELLHVISSESPRINPISRQTPQFVKHESVQATPADLLTRSKTRSAFAVVRPEASTDPQNKSPCILKKPSDNAIVDRSISQISDDDLSRRKHHNHHHHFCHNFAWNGDHPWHNICAHHCEHHQCPLNTCQHSALYLTKVESPTGNRDSRNADKNTSLTSTSSLELGESACSGVFINISKSDWIELLNEALHMINRVVRVSRETYLLNRMPSVSHQHDSKKHECFKHRKGCSPHKSSPLHHSYEPFCSNQHRGHFPNVHSYGPTPKCPHSCGSCFHHANEGGEYGYPMEGSSMRRSAGPWSFKYIESRERFYDWECQLSSHHASL